jgi:hypothetical protein
MGCQMHECKYISVVIISRGMEGGQVEFAGPDTRDVAKTSEYECLKLNVEC